MTTRELEKCMHVTIRDLYEWAKENNGFDTEIYIVSDNDRDIEYAFPQVEKNSKGEIVIVMN